MNKKDIKEEKCLQQEKLFIIKIQTDSDNGKTAEEILGILLSMSPPSLIGYSFKELKLPKIPKEYYP